MWIVLTDDAKPSLGGVATWTGWAAQTLASQGPVTVFRRKGPVAMGVPGVRVVDVPGPSFGRYGALWTAMAAASSLGSAEQVLATTWAVGRHVSRLAPTHVVAHGGDVTQPPRSGGFQGTWRRAAGRWAVSESLVRNLQHRGVQARRLPLPMPPAPLVRGGERWVMVSRAVPGKGGERFVALVAAAGVQADVVGDGPSLASWRREAARLGAQIRFHGALCTHQLHDVLEHAAAVFQLSVGNQEGLGLSLLEARARGVPVVGSTEGGLPEAVGNGLVLQGFDARRQAEEVQDWLATRPVPDWTDEREGFLECLCG